MQDEAFAEFLIESEENLDLFDRKMVELEATPDNQAIINEIFRAVHTIKGTAGFFGLPSFESLSHAGENVLGALRDGKLFLSPRIVSSLLAMGDALRLMLGNIREHGNEGSQSHEELTKGLKQLLEGGKALSPAFSKPATKLTPAVTNITELERQSLAEGSRATAKIRAMALPPSTPPPATPAAPAPKPAEPPAARAEVTSPSTSSNQHTALFSSSHSSHEPESIRVDVNLLGKLMDLVGELVLTRNQVLQHSVLQQDVSLLRVVQRLNLVTSELQEGLTKTRMQTIGNLWRKLPRVVRDLSISCGKKVEVEMEGQETEMDKSVIEAIKDPLTHLVRNALDHGIEAPAARVAQGKSPEGKLLLKAFHESGKVKIEISDDGAGVNIERVKKKAIEKQLISAEQAAKMSEREALSLIFLPGFSTAEQVTNISGRGVGMDVVKTNIEKIGGTIDLHSVPGVGTKFQIQIPLTLAIIPALLVSAGGQQYAIAQSHIIELVRLNNDDQKIELLHNAPVYRLREQLLPLVFLREVLGLPAADEPSAISIAVLYAEHGPFGLVVDHINDTSEIVIKPIAKQLKNLSLYAGTTLMGDGRVSLILDVAHLSSLCKHKGQKAKSIIKATMTQQSARSLLIFRVGDSRLAAPLNEISRIECVPQHLFERSMGREVIQYRGELLRLIRLDRALQLPSSEQRRALPILVVQSGGRVVGLVIDEILDSLEQEYSVKASDTRFGFLGSVVIQEKVTDLVDLAAIIQSEQQESTYV